MVQFSKGVAPLIILAFLSCCNPNTNPTKVTVDTTIQIDKITDTVQIAAQDTAPQTILDSTAKIQIKTQYDSGYQDSLSKIHQKVEREINDVVDVYQYQKGNLKDSLLKLHRYYTDQIRNLEKNNRQYQLKVEQFRDSIQFLTEKTVNNPCDKTKTWRERRKTTNNIFYIIGILVALLISGIVANKTGIL